MSRFDEVAKAATDYMQRLQRAIGDFRPTLLTPTQAGGRLSATRPDQRDRFRHLASLWVVGNIALAVVTWVCFQLGTNLTTAAFAFLIVIVLLSLMDSFVSSSFFSVVAVACLNFFFVEPLFTIQIEYAQDLTALAAFLIASLAVTGLVRRVRRLGEVQEEQVSLLDLITDAVFVRDVNDKITYWNRGAEELYGWKRDEAVGKVTHQLLQTVFPARLAETSETLTRTGRWEGELLHTRRDGTRVTVASRWSLQQDERGRPIGTLESNTDITERKKSEDALRRSETQRELELTIDTIPALVVTYNPDGRCDFVNRTWQDYTGITLQEARGEGRPDFHPEDIDPVDRAWRASLATGEPFSIELRARRADGSYRRHDVRRVPLHDAQGKVIKWYGVAFDIEDQKGADDTLRRSEAQLARAEQELRVTLDTIPTLAWQTGADGFAEYINKRLLDFTGLSLEQALSLDHWLTAIHPEDTQGLLSDWRKILATKTPFDVEARMRRFDGAYRWFLFRAEPLRDETGKVVRWYGTNTDIEDRKRAENALRRSEAYLAEAQKLSHTGSFGWNGSSGEIFWSEETFRIFGYEPTTNVAMNMVFDRVHPDDVALVRRAMDRAATHKEAFDFEHRVLMPDGSIKHLHIVAHALIDEPHNLQFAGAVMDVTAHKQIEQALRHSEKRYQNMFQAMSVSLWELDYSRAGEMLRFLYGTGVVDLVAYFRANPKATRELLQATWVVDVNDQTVALFGQGSKEDLLTNIEPYWPEESWDDYIAAVVTSFGGNKFSTETRLRKLDGTIFDAHMTTWYASEDKTTGLIGIVDITARKQAFSKLEASERRYRDLFQYMPIGLVQVDATKLIPLFKELRAQGVTDLKTYIDEHPEVLPSAVEALEVEEVNQHTVKLFGARSAAEMRGPITRYWQPGIPTLRRSIEARYRGQENFQEETKVARMDGTAIDVLYTSARAGPRADKSLVGLIDITERKQAEEGLRRSEQRYRHLFHHMPVALWQLNARGVLEQFKQLRTDGVTDLEAHFDAHPDFVQRCMEMLIIEEVNEHTVLMLGGRDTSGFIGTSVADYFPKGSPTFRRSMVSRYRGDPNYAAETKLFALDGRVVDVLYTASRVGPISEPGMSLLGVIDITERKQAEEGLRRSEQRYQNLFQAMAVAFFEFDFSGARDLLRRLRASGVTNFRQHFTENPETVRQFMRATRVLEVNDQTVALLGRGSKEGLLDNVEPFWPEESIQAYAETILSALERKPSFSIETPLSRTDGSVFDGHFTVWYSAEEPTRGLGGVIDISERVKAQSMLNQVRADFAHAARISMLGELTASIAHETNQPLAAIAASGEASLRWLARSTPDINEVRELTKSVVADARRASEIIGRVRAMAAGRAPEQALLSLDDVIGEALLFLRHEVESRGVAVSHIPAFDPQKVFGDRTQLQQVIVNLAVNAMQAMAQTGSTKRNISIRTVARDPATLCCSVEDSGPGIEPLHITRLFDSFFTTKNGGMGMGLRICRSVIEAHGGRIAADNESAQGGARLYFTLPVASTVA